MVPRINPYQLEAIGTKTCNNNNLNCSDLRTYFYTSHPDILHIDTATFEATILGKVNPWTTNAIKITELWPASRLVNARQKQSIKQLTFSASVYRHACLRTPEIRRTINIMAEEIATTKLQGHLRVEKTRSRQDSILGDYRLVLNIDYNTS